MHVILRGFECPTRGGGRRIANRVRKQVEINVDRPACDSGQTAPKYGGRAIGRNVDEVARHCVGLHDGEGRRQNDGSGLVAWPCPVFLVPAKRSGRLVPAAHPTQCPVSSRSRTSNS